MAELLLQRNAQVDVLEHRLHLCLHVRQRLGIDAAEWNDGADACIPRWVQVCGGSAAKVWRAGGFAGQGNVSCMLSQLLVRSLMTTMFCAEWSNSTNNSFEIRATGGG